MPSPSLPSPFPSTSSPPPSTNPLVFAHDLKRLLIIHEPSCLHIDHTNPLTWSNSLGQQSALRAPLPEGTPDEALTCLSWYCIMLCIHVLLYRLLCTGCYVQLARIPTANFNILHSMLLINISTGYALKSIIHAPLSWCSYLYQGGAGTFQWICVPGVW